MSLAHLLGLDADGERWLCTSCGRFGTVRSDGDSADGNPVRGPDADPECPNCGSRDMRRLALL